MNQHACSVYRYIEVARAAVWSLGRMAGAALTPAAVIGMAVPQQAWSLLSGHVLQMVVQMLQSCHLQVRAVHLCA